MDNSNPISNHHQFKDLTGLRFGKLIVLGSAGRAKRRLLWECLCDCGRSKIVSSKKLLRKDRLPTRSCGCLRGTSKKHGHTTKNGVSLEYKSWSHMIRRCTDPNSHNYKWYGGKGIKVHPRYLKFQNFLDDLGPRPSPKHSIDRIDGTKNYEPGNLRWATQKEQVRNQNKTIIIVFNGETRPLVEWAEILNIHRSTLYDRLNRYGWSIADTLTVPSGGKRPQITTENSMIDTFL